MLQMYILSSIGGELELDSLTKLMRLEIISNCLIYQVKSNMIKKYQL